VTQEVAGSTPKRSAVGNDLGQVVQGLSKGDEHPTNTPRGIWYCF